MRPYHTIPRTPPNYCIIDLSDQSLRLFLLIFLVLSRIFEGRCHTMKANTKHPIYCIDAGSDLS